MNGFMTEKLKRFNYLSGEINAVYHEAALKFRMSDSALTVLYAICCNGEECLLSDISKLSGMSKQTINSALRRLEKNGVIYLEAVNGRKKKVCLTGRGHDLVEGTVAHLIEIENNIFDSWSETEQEVYLELTRRYLAVFKEKVGHLGRSADTLQAEQRMTE